MRRLTSFANVQRPSLRLLFCRIRTTLIGVQSISRLLELLSKLLLVALTNTFVSFVSVVWLWAAVKERQSSSLPNLLHSADTSVLLARFFALTFVVNILYLAWIFIMITRASSTVMQRKIRSDRIEFGNVLPLVVAIAEVVIFRYLWNGYQVHSSVDQRLILNPLVDLEDLGSLLLVVGWLRWTKTKVMRWVPRVTGNSMEPVVGVRQDGSLLLADGAVIPRWPILTWPINGIGKSKVVAILSEPGGGDVYVTNRGDCFHPPAEQG